MTAVSALRGLLERARLPEGLQVALADPTAPQPPLKAVEEAAVLRAVAGRRAEFAAGRAAARSAVAALGAPEAAIPMAEDRAPVWPQGITGSLSHTGTACVAVAARMDMFAGLGVDLEDDLPMPEDSRDAAGSPEEARGLDSDPLRAARRLFSLKEAAYKAQYSLSRTLIDFDALYLDPEARTLRFTRDVPPFAKGTALAVSQWVWGGLILSLCCLPASPPDVLMDEAALPSKRPFYR